jgi:hypothetical protein
MNTTKPQITVSIRTVVVSLRTVYGNQLIYPSCENAHRFANIARSKTLSSSAIQDIKVLGFEVVVRQPEINL